MKACGSANIAKEYCENELQKWHVWQGRGMAVAGGMAINHSSSNELQNYANENLETVLVFDGFQACSLQRKSGPDIWVTLSKRKMKNHSLHEPCSSMLNNRINIINWKL